MYLFDSARKEGLTIGEAVKLDTQDLNSVMDEEIVEAESSTFSHHILDDNSQKSVEET